MPALRLALNAMRCPPGMLPGIAALGGAGIPHRQSPAQGAFAPWRCRNGAGNGIPGAGRGETKKAPVVLDGGRGCRGGLVDRDAVSREEVVPLRRHIDQVILDALRAN